MSAGILKFEVGRPRPCRARADPPQVHQGGAVEEDELLDLEDLRYLQP